MLAARCVAAVEGGRLIRIPDEYCWNGVRLATVPPLLSALGLGADEEAGE